MKNNIAVSSMFVSQFISIISILFGYVGCGDRTQYLTGGSGSLYPGFGIVTSNPSNRSPIDNGWDKPQAMALDSTAMYVVGWASRDLQPLWRIEKRGLMDGILVTEFGTSGIVSSDIRGATPFAIALDSTAMYVVGFDNLSPNRQWIIEKRNLPDGSLVAGFGMSGVVTSNSSEGTDIAYAIAIDSEAIYVAGSDETPGNPQWRIEKRNLTDGSLVKGFGRGGVVTSNPSGNRDGVMAITLDSTALYIAGYDESSFDIKWRIEKRIK